MTCWLTSSFEVENKCFEFQKEFMIDTCLMNQWVNLILSNG